MQNPVSVSVKVGIVDHLMAAASRGDVCFGYRESDQIALSNCKILLYILLAAFVIGATICSYHITL